MTIPAAKRRFIICLVNRLQGFIREFGKSKALCISYN